jgi:hypothetical protein
MGGSAHRFNDIRGQECKGASSRREMDAPMLGLVDASMCEFMLVCRLMRHIV